jgi:ferredoxin
MKITLNEQLCDAHGDCVVAAPELFSLGDDDDVARLLIAEPPPELHAKAREAADACPAQAIVIEE